MVAGVIASSPLVLQTFPASKVLRFIGGKASAVLPNVLIDAPIVVEVRVPVRVSSICLFHLGYVLYAYISGAYSRYMRSFPAHMVDVCVYSRRI